MGSGNQSFTDTGTSMATPQVAGIGGARRRAGAPALERGRGEPGGDPGVRAGKARRLCAASSEGAGLAQAVGATRTQAVVFGEGGSPNPLSFGFSEFSHNFSKDSVVDVVNNGGTPVVFNVTATKSTSVPHQLRLGQTSLYVPAHGATRLDVTLAVPAATVGTTHDSQGNDRFADVAGYLTFKPQSASMNGGASLQVPYYLVPRARSNVIATPLLPLSARLPKSTLLLSNFLGAVPGTADLYSWGLASPSQGLKYLDVRAVGVQSDVEPFFAATDRLLVFAVNMHKRFSALGYSEMDIYIDNNGDGNPGVRDHHVRRGRIHYRSGFVAGQVNGTFVYNFATGTLHGPSSSRTRQRMAPRCFCRWMRLM